MRLLEEGIKEEDEILSVGSDIALMKAPNAVENSPRTFPRAPKLHRSES